MELLITKEDADKEQGFYDGENCLVAVALKRVFPNSNFILVGGFGFRVDKQRFRMENHNDVYDKFYDLADKSEFEPFVINYRPAEWGEIS
jgi:hypothetical protein